MTLTMPPNSIHIIQSWTRFIALAYIKLEKGRKKGHTLYKSWSSAQGKVYEIENYLDCSLHF